MCISFLWKISVRNLTLIILNIFSYLIDLSCMPVSCHCSLSLRMLSLHFLGFSTSCQVTSLCGYSSQTHLNILSLCARSSYCRDVGGCWPHLTLPPWECIRLPLLTPTLTTIILFGLLCLVPACPLQGQPHLIWAPALSPLPPQP